METFKNTLIVCQEGESKELLEEEKRDREMK